MIQTKLSFTNHKLQIIHPDNDDSSYNDDLSNKNNTSIKASDKQLDTYKSNKLSNKLSKKLSNKLSKKQHL